VGKGKNKKGYKVLVADDQKDIRDLVVGVLTEAGYEVVQAANGEDALHLAKTEAPDLILLDIKMPRMEGTAVKARMNENSSLANIPVIFVTGNISVEDKVKGFHLGIDDYITKPFSLKELLARVDAAISRRKYYEEISMTDGLTGLMNIHYFKKQFALFFDLAKRRETDIFSLAVMDIDNFKNINDVHGHSVGDFVLKKLSKVLTDSLRKTDVITRYGGDEFTVLFPQNSKGEAAEALKRARSAIEGKVFKDNDTGLSIGFAVSSGVSEFKSSFDNATQMFEAADQEMYREKKNKEKTG
jgi:two-component system, cell cycle response regulator